jgi:hypothetical protein
MAVAELKRTARVKTFTATMVVTRTEEWYVEAESAAEARALLAVGAGHRCHVGDCLHVEVDELFDEA